MVDLNKDWIKSVAKRTKDRIIGDGYWSYDFEKILIEELQKPFPEQVPLNDIKPGQKFKMMGFTFTKLINGVIATPGHSYYISENWELCHMRNDEKVIPL